MLLTTPIVPTLGFIFSDLCTTSEIYNATVTVQEVFTVMACASYKASTMRVPTPERRVILVAKSAVVVYNQLQ